MYFSIIIPTFNSEKYIKQCLTSILNQTFQNFEILIMDGNSTDTTLEIAKKFKNDHIKIQSEKDKGIYDAMNKGIGLAQGTWLYFLGSDDVLKDSQVLQNVFDLITACPEDYDVVYGDVESEQLGKKYDGFFTIEKLVSYNICHQAIFYKKTLFDSLGHYNLKYKFLADYDFNLRWMLTEGVKSKYVDLVICKYASGGLSEIQTDHAFVLDKYRLIRQYGTKTIPLFKAKAFCRNNLEFIKYAIWRMLKRLTA